MRIRNIFIFIFWSFLVSIIWTKGYSLTCPSIPAKYEVIDDNLFWIPDHHKCIPDSYKTHLLEKWITDGKEYDNNIYSTSNFLYIWWVKVWSVKWRETPIHLRNNDMVYFSNDDYVIHRWGWSTKFLCDSWWEFVTWDYDDSSQIIDAKLFYDNETCEYLEWRLKSWEWCPEFWDIPCEIIDSDKDNNLWFVKNMLYIVIAGFVAIAILLIWKLYFQQK